MAAVDRKRKHNGEEHQLPSETDRFITYQCNETAESTRKNMDTNRASLSGSVMSLVRRAVVSTKSPHVTE